MDIPQHADGLAVRPNDRQQALKEVPYRRRRRLKLVCLLKHVANLQARNSELQAEKEELEDIIHSQNELINELQSAKADE